MNPLLIKPLADFGTALIDRFFPDKTKAEEAKAQMLVMLSTQDFQTVMAQLEINAKEAVSPSLWVSGGRPFFIWIGGAGFGYAVLLQPLLAWVSLINGWPEPPLLNIDLLWVVVSGLLGLGTMRSFDKLKGTSK